MADATRYLPNTYSDQLTAEDFSRSLSTLQTCLSASLPRLEAAVQRHRSSLGADLYQGCAGLALLYLRLHDIDSQLQAMGAGPLLPANTKRQRAGGKDQAGDKEREGHTYLHTAADLLDTGNKSSKAARGPSVLTGSVGPLVVAAALTARRGQKVEEDVLGKVVRVYDSLAPSSPFEVLYGLAGHLWGCLLLWVETGRGKEGALVDHMHRVVRDLVTAGRDGHRRGVAGAADVGEKEPPLSYVWRDKPYLGAAHGLAGIVHVLLLTEMALGGCEGAEEVRACVDYLIGWELPSCNYATKVESRAHIRDRLCQWCHGAPGMCLLLCAAYTHYKDEKYLSAATRAGECVWALGLLHKGGCLCHGVGGNGLALLALYRVSGHVLWRNRALAFATYCAHSLLDWLDGADTGSHVGPYTGASGGLLLVADMVGLLVCEGVGGEGYWLGGGDTPPPFWPLPGFQLPQVDT